MSKTKDVKTSVGTWVLKKPKAGVRNRAMAAAETDSGKIKHTVLMMELIPVCVQSRPDGFDKDVPIDQVINDLEIEDYDALVDALGDLIADEKELEEKKKP